MATLSLCTYYFSRYATGVGTVLSHIIRHSCPKSGQHVYPRRRLFLSPPSTPLTLLDKQPSPRGGRAGRRRRRATPTCRVLPDTSQQFTNHEDTTHNDTTRDDATKSAIIIWHAGRRNLRRARYGGGALDPRVLDSTFDALAHGGRKTPTGSPRS